MPRVHEPRPRAREKDLIVQDLPDEVLVYDLERHKAHCLSPASAAVWRQCDGHRTPAEIARRMSGRAAAGLDEGAVWVALHRLSKAHLLEAPIRMPQGSAKSRREWLKKAAGLAGITVATIVVPTAAFAVSCVPGNVCCATPQSKGRCQTNDGVPCCTSRIPCAVQGNAQLCSCGGGCT